MKSNFHAPSLPPSLDTPLPSPPYLPPLPPSSPPLVPLAPLHTTPHNTTQHHTTPHNTTQHTHNTTHTHAPHHHTTTPPPPHHHHHHHTTTTTTTTTPHHTTPPHPTPPHPTPPHTLHTLHTTHTTHTPLLARFSQPCCTHVYSSHDPRIKIKQHIVAVLTTCAEHFFCSGLVPSLMCTFFPFRFRVLVDCLALTLTGRLRNISGGL